VFGRDRVSLSRRYALTLFVVALVAVVTGPMVLPHELIWITAGVLFWAAGTIWYRTLDWPKKLASTDAGPQAEPAPDTERAPELS
jgi:hypothetical protein